MSLPPFQLLRPRTIAAAVAALDRHQGNIKIIAGGTDVIPSLKQNLFAPRFVLDLRGIAELQGIRVVPGGGTEIGALTSLSALEHSAHLREHYSVLREAARTVASPILRNMGTIGGNICLDTRCLWYNQSLAWRKSCGFCIKKDGDLCHVAPGSARCWAAFSGDTPPALLCLDAELEVASAAGARRVKLRDFYNNDGIACLRMGKDELLTRIFLPQSSAGLAGAYQKLRMRGSIDYPLAGVAVALKRHALGNGHPAGEIADVRMAITAVNPSPLLVPGLDQILAGKFMDDDLARAAGDCAASTAKPLTTSALTPEYRREMVRVFARRVLLAASAMPN